MRFLDTIDKSWLKDALVVLMVVATAWIILFSSMQIEFEMNIQSEVDESTAKQDLAWYSVQKLFTDGIELRFESKIYQPEVLALLEKAQDPKQEKQARLDLYRLLYPYYQSHQQSTDDKF
ncbi:MAG: hypothetical protein U9R28_07900, partial [Pseudomonadota bacterium]|nr:hypothetical protein [Pseudomonadota bacterium]